MMVRISGSRHAVVTAGLLLLLLLHSPSAVLAGGWLIDPPHRTLSIPSPRDLMSYPCGCDPDVCTNAANSDVTELNAQYNVAWQVQYPNEAATDLRIELCRRDLSQCTTLADGQLYLGEQLTGNRAGWTVRMPDDPAWIGDVTIRWTATRPNGIVYHSCGNLLLQDVVLSTNWRPHKCCRDRDCPSYTNKCFVGACKWGKCTDEPVCCDDWDECTRDECDPVHGCQYHPIPGCGSECSSNADCDDQDPCTVDSCNDDGECLHEYTVNEPQCPCLASNQCDDGDPCTTDICTGGACQHRYETNAPQCPCSDPRAEECDDGDDCTVDSCGTLGFCVFDYQYAPGTCPCRNIVDCDDDDQCTDDTCDEEGVCVNRFVINPPACPCTDPAAPACDDNDDCTEDSCDAGEGKCRHEFEYIEELCPCTDAAQCPTSTACHVASCDNGLCSEEYEVSMPDCPCRITEPDDCDDDNACTVDVCEGAACLNIYEIGPNCPCRTDDDCDDFDACTVNVCQNDGTCDYSQRIINPDIGCPCRVAFETIDCFDDDMCTTDECNPTTGLCFHIPINEQELCPCSTNADCYPVNENECGFCDDTTGLCAFEQVANPETCRQDGVFGDVPPDQQAGAQSSGGMMSSMGAGGLLGSAAVIVVAAGAAVAVRRRRQSMESELRGGNAPGGSADRTSTEAPAKKRVKRSHQPSPVTPPRASSRARTPRTASMATTASSKEAAKVLGLEASRKARDPGMLRNRSRSSLPLETLRASPAVRAPMSPDAGSASKSTVGKARRKKPRAPHSRV